MKYWSLTTLREKLIKIEAKVVRHAKYVTFQMTDVSVPRELFVDVLERIQAGAPPSGTCLAVSRWIQSPERERRVRQTTPRWRLGLGTDLRTAKPTSGTCPRFEAR